MKHAIERKAVRIAAVVAVVLAVGPVGALRARGRVAKVRLPGVKASENPCLKYMPADWWLVANVDIKAYFEFAARDKEGLGAGDPGSAMLKQYTQLIQMFTGIDVAKDLQYATIILSGDPDGDVSFLGAVKGTFNNALVRGRIAGTMGQGMKEQFYGGQTIYVGPGLAYCLPEAGTILVGDTAGLKRTIDRMKKAPFKMPPSLEKTLDRTNAASIVWTAMRPKVILDVSEFGQWRKEHSTFYKAMAQIEYLSVFFEMADDGVLVNALACLPGAAEAKGLGAYLAKRKDALLKTEGANVLFCSFLVMSRLATDERYVRGSLHLTGKALLELWNTKVIVKPKQ